jgi:hypothetical protein
MKSVWSVALICASAIVAYQANGQSKAPAEYVPLPDPGYGLYYHDTQAAPNTATRWGYHDGWIDGRHDRNHGDSDTARQKTHYLTPTEHGLHAGTAHDQYVKAYRDAYVHGYEHGSRI